MFIGTLGLFKAFATSPQPLIVTDYIYPTSEVTLEEFLLEEVSIPSGVLYDKSYLKKIREWNPHIGNEALIKGEEIYLELPYGTSFNVATSNNNFQISPSLGDKPQPISRDKTPSPTFMVHSENNKLENSTKKKWRLSGLYTLSAGLFNQENTKEGISANSQQNSPLNFTVISSYNFTSIYKLTSSFYFSKLTSTSSNLDSGINIPLEYGLNTYLHHSPQSWKITPYGGFDYESFSTFNISELNLGIEPTSIKHNFTFLTLGAETNFKALSRPWRAKGSIAQSLHSTSSRSPLHSNEVFSGQRFLLFLEMKGSSNWSYHTVLKHYLLGDGVEDLKITRIGFGIGYQFI